MRIKSQLNFSKAKYLHICTRSRESHLAELRPCKSSRDEVLGGHRISKKIIRFETELVALSEYAPPIRLRRTNPSIRTPAILALSLSTDINALCFSAFSVMASLYATASHVNFISSEFQGSQCYPTPINLADPITYNTFFWSNVNEQHNYAFVFSTPRLLLGQCQKLIATIHPFLKISKHLCRS